jgi:hypothetical protein
LFTHEDIEYLKKYIDYCVAQGLVLSLREICERVAVKVCACNLNATAILKAFARPLITRMSSSCGLNVSNIGTVSIHGAGIVTSTRFVLVVIP